MEPPVQPEQPAQISIRHLFQFTFSICIVLGVQIGIATWKGAYQTGIEQLTPGWAAIWLANSMALGLATTGLVHYLGSKASGVSFPNHPSEYLWILLGASSLAGLIHPIGRHLCLFVGGFIAAWKSRGSPWTWFYNFVAASPFIVAILSAATVRLIQTPAMSYMTFAFALIEWGLLVAAILPMTAHRPWTWAGRLGAASLLAIAASQLIYAIAVSFAM